MENPFFCTSSRDKFEDTLLRKKKLIEKERQENKAQRPAGFEPTTSGNSTAVLPPLAASVQANHKNIGALA